MRLPLPVSDCQTVAGYQPRSTTAALGAPVFKPATHNCPSFPSSSPSRCAPASRFHPPYGPHPAKACPCSTCPPPPAPRSQGPEAGRYPPPASSADPDKLLALATELKAQVA